jgi:hypothetical protein
MSIKCGSCGLVNWDTACNCRRCNAPVGMQAQGQSQRQQFHPQSLPDGFVQQVAPHLPQPPMMNPPLPLPPQNHFVPQPQNLAPQPMPSPAPLAIRPEPLAQQSPNQKPELLDNLQRFPYADQNQQPPVNPYQNHQTQQAAQPNPNLQAQVTRAPYANPQAAPNVAPHPQGLPNGSFYPAQPPSANPAPYANPQAFGNQRVYHNPQAFGNGPGYQGQFLPPGAQRPFAAPAFQGQFPASQQGNFPMPYAPGPYVRPPNFTTQPSISPKLKILLAMMVIGAGVFLFVIKGMLDKKRLETIGEKALTVKYLKVPNQNPNSVDGIRENLLVYLGKDKDSRFGYDEMQRQLFAGVDEMAYDQEKGEVLLLVKGCSDKDSANLQRVISNYATNPALTFYGDACKQKINAFHGKTMSGWVNHCPLVIPADNIRINPYTSIEIKYSSATYKLSLQELSNFMTDKSVYGGHMRIFSKDVAHNELNVFGNHGAFVARANEPSLTRLATALTLNASISGLGLRENRIQKLVDFVSQEITYDESEAKFKGEILKRPDETLLTRRGDCSSKSILLASLLEQVGEEYRLIYYNDHITVAVRKGNFANANGLSFNRDGETWMIAESTLPGFRVGETIVENAQIFSAMRYVQKPSSSESVSALDDLREIVFE